MGAVVSVVPFVPFVPFVPAVPVLASVEGCEASGTNGKSSTRSFGFGSTRVEAGAFLAGDLADLGGMMDVEVMRVWSVRWLFSRDDALVRSVLEVVLIRRDATNLQVCKRGRKVKAGGIWCVHADCCVRLLQGCPRVSCYRRIAFRR